MHHSAESGFSNLIETEFENSLFTGAKICLNQEKNTGQISRDKLPLKMVTKLKDRNKKQPSVLVNVFFTIIEKFKEKMFVLHSSITYYESFNFWGPCAVQCTVGCVNLYKKNLKLKNIPSLW